MYTGPTNTPGQSGHLIDDHTRGVHAAHTQYAGAAVRGVGPTGYWYRRQPLFCALGQGCAKEGVAAHAAPCQPSVRPMEEEEEAMARRGPSSFCQDLEAKGATAAHERRPCRRGTCPTIINLLPLEARPTPVS